MNKKKKLLMTVGLSSVLITPAVLQQVKSNNIAHPPVLSIFSRVQSIAHADNNTTSIQYASCDGLNHINVTLNHSLQGDLKSQVSFDNGDGIKDISQNGNTLSITTNNNIDFQKKMEVKVDNAVWDIREEDGTAMPVVRSVAFDDAYYYSGNDLGANYSSGSTTFKLWAPTAQNVSLNLFQSTDPKAKLKSWTPMKYEGHGVWSVTVQGDLKDTAYDFNVEFADGSANETYDPYATACTEYGNRSVILSPAEMGAPVKSIADGNHPTNDQIEEIHVRDFTIDPSSGVPANLRGTYLGAIQKGAKNSAGQPTGLDYLKSLGINTVQIQPMFEYDDPDGHYDWGYDPHNYNVPEGLYSTNREDPATRIRECKAMIQGFHDAGIKVNMDVVYNHVSSTGDNALAKTVPGYYFHYGSNGKLTNSSGCGNDVASNRKMVRKYIVHSVNYWHDEYGVDGYRFDLMGNLDVDTMNEIAKDLPNSVIYGEGWNLGTNIPDNEKADQWNEPSMPAIGSFNGWGRDVMRGNGDGKTPGFIDGDSSQDSMWRLANFLLGSQNRNTGDSARDKDARYVNANQVINYAECHDNKTLFDKIKTIYPNEPDNVTMRRAELANSITYLAAGVPFSQMGQEFGRSKNGDANSYNTGDAENSIKWNNENTYNWSVNYEKGLIKLRKQLSSLRSSNFDDIAKNMTFLQQGNGIVTYKLNDPSGTYIIGFSSDPSEQPMQNIPDGKYQVLIKDCNSYLDNPQTIDVKNSDIKIPSLSAIVLKQVNDTDNKPATSTSSSSSNSSSSSKPAVSSSSQQNKPASSTSTPTVSSSASSQTQPTASSSSSAQPAASSSSSAAPSNTTSSPNNPGASSSSQPAHQDSSQQKGFNYVDTIIYKTADGKQVGTYEYKWSNLNPKDAFNDNIAKEHCPQGYHIIKKTGQTSPVLPDVENNQTIPVAYEYEVAKDAPASSSTTESTNKSDTNSAQKSSSSITDKNQSSAKKDDTTATVSKSDNNKSATDKSTDNKGNTNTTVKSSSAAANKDNAANKTNGDNKANDAKSSSHTTASSITASSTKSGAVKATDSSKSSASSVSGASKKSATSSSTDKAKAQSSSIASSSQKSSNIASETDDHATDSNKDNKSEASSTEQDTNASQSSSTVKSEAEQEPVKNGYKSANAENGNSGNSANVSPETTTTTTTSTSTSTEPGDDTYSAQKAAMLAKTNAKAEQGGIIATIGAIFATIAGWFGLKKKDN